MSEKNNDANGETRLDTTNAATLLDCVSAGIVFDDPVAYLDRFGIKASIVAETSDQLRRAA